MQGQNQHWDMLEETAAEYPSEGKPAPMEYEVGRNGLALKSAALAAPAIISSSAVGGEPLPHG